MPFGLINVGETFQRAMDIAFRGPIGDCAVVYLDDVTIFSKDKKDHITHLRRVFNMCRRKYYLTHGSTPHYLEPKKKRLDSIHLNIKAFKGHYA
jgi:hypothetical protein